MYLDYIIYQIHQLFNESRKAKVACKCDRRGYDPPIIHQTLSKNNLFKWLKIKLELSV